jgi:mercuric reductase
VDTYGRTTNPKIYAAGDVTGEPMYVYVAARAGALAAENALSDSSLPLDLSVVPRVTFTDPSVAVVGLTEVAAREAGFDPITSVLPMEHVPRALAAHDTRGFVKLVADADTRRILGAAILAPEAVEMIMEPTLAVKHGLTIEDLVDTLHPYLTFGEGVRLAAQTFDKEVAALSCCAA